MASDPSDAPPSAGEKIEFSLSRGGLIYPLFRRLGFYADKRWSAARVAIVVVALTWLPMAVLSILQGVAWGGRVEITFFSDISVAARFLIAVPLFVIAASIVDARLTWAVNSFLDLGLVTPEMRADFLAPMHKLARRRNSILPELVLALVAFGLAWGAGHAPVVTMVSSWMAVGDPPVRTMAGRWLDYFSMPVCMLFVLTWLWRILLWWYFLRQTAKLDLKLVPTHPDRCAGLGFLGETQPIFGIVLAPIGVMMAARAALLVHHATWDVSSAKTQIAMLIGLGLVVAFGPLVSFAPKLVRLRRKGIEVYGGLAQEYVRRFDRKWIRGGAGADEELLGTGDIQSLADIGNSYTVVREMRPLPIQMRHVATVVALMFLPMIPIIATVIPLKTMIESLVNIVTSAR